VRAGILPGLRSDPTQSELIKGLNSLGLNDYLRAQQEALEVLAWLKRYADAGLWE
jgi:hypothetical protein